MAMMAGVVAVGTWLTRLAVLCDNETGEQYRQPTPPAVAMLVGLGVVAAAALLLGALLRCAPLRHRVDPRGTPTRPAGGQVSRAAMMRAHSLGEAALLSTTRS